MRSSFFARSCGYGRVVSTREREFSRPAEAEVYCQARIGAFAWSFSEVVDWRRPSRAARAASRFEELWEDIVVLGEGIGG